MGLTLFTSPAEGREVGNAAVLASATLLGDGITRVTGALCFNACPGPFSAMSCTTRPTSMSATPEASGAVIIQNQLESHANGQSKKYMSRMVAFVLLYFLYGG